MGPISAGTRRQAIIVTSLRVLTVGLLYWSFTRLGVEIAVDQQFTSTWIPAGVAFVATLRWGRWMVVGVGVGEFVASFQSGIPAGVAVALGVGSAAAPLVAVAVLRHLGLNRSIQRVRDVFVLVFAISVGAAIGASINVGAFYFSDEFDHESIARQWPHYWASVAFAVLLVSPFVLALLEDAPTMEFPRSRKVEALIVAVAIVVTSAYAIDGSQPFMSVLLYPLFVWSAMRFDVIGASGSILLATVTAAVFQLYDPAFLPDLGLDEAQKVLALQAIIVVAVASNLVLATLLRERDASRVEAERAAAALTEAQAIAEVGSWEWSLRDDVVNTSAELARMFVLDPAGTTLGSILERVHVDDRPALERAIDDAVANGGGFAIEHRILAGPYERIVRHAGRMVGRPRGNRRLVATALDITERTSVDRLRDALIATASHELRTPLTSIVGFADTLIEQWDRFDEHRRLEFLRIIHAQGERLSMVIDDTLMQSRIDSGSIAVVDDPYPVASAIRDAVLIARADRVDVRCDSAYVAIGSQEHLTQIVLNFLTNAAKYGAPPIDIEVVEADHGSALEVRVIDHGSGVDAAFQERLFERFTRGPGTDGQPGTGLGLSIVRGLVESNGGRVWYERDGDRTVFACTVRRWSRVRARR